MATKKKNITKLSQKVLTGLKKENKPMKPEELMVILGINLRSVRYSLKLLLEADLVDKYPDLNDLRSFYYAPRKINNRIKPTST